MGKLEVKLLGKPEVYWRGKKVFFRFVKLEALFYYLLVRKSASREELANLLWGDMEEAAAKKNLRNTIYLLKKLTTEDLLFTPSRANVLLNTEAVNVSTDIQRFAETELEESLTLYRGDFLEGFICADAEPFESWVHGQRQRLKEEMISRLTKVIVGQINNKDYKGAKHYLQQLILLDEYNESAYRALMKIYEREGAFKKAIDVYRELEYKLSAELGIQPDTKTKEVIHRIGVRKIAQPAPGKKQAGKLFFGRTQELRWLQGVLDDFYASRHPRSLIVLYGEQGVGKTAIMQQLHEFVPATGVTLFRTQCYQAEQGYPYKAWNQIFCQTMELLAQRQVVLPAMWCQVMSYVFPAAVYSTVTADQAEPAYTYNLYAGMIEEVMCAILGRVAGQGQLVLVVEDIQWVDMQSWSVLRQLLRILGTRVICIATCRNENLESFERLAGEFSREGLLERLSVENFSREEVVQFSTLVLPADKVNAELQQKLYDYTGGNALFLVESINLIQMGQDIERLSPRLRSVLQERMNGISDNAKKVLEVISVFFNNTSYDELLAICGMNEFEIVEAIEELQQKQLILEVSFSTPDAGGPVYKYSHIRIRDYVYTQLSSSRQRMIHLRAGSYLEGLVQGDSRGRDLYSDILYHYSQIGEKLKILEYTIKIAENYSCPQYELFPDLSEVSMGGNGCIFEDRIQIRGYLDKIKELLVLLEQEMVGEGRINRFRAAYLEMLGRYYIWQGNHRNGLRAIHRLLRLAAEKGFDDYLIKGYQQIVYCGIQIRNPQLIEGFAGKLLRKVQEAHWQEKKATVLRFLGISHALRQEHALAEQYYRQSISQFKRMQKSHQGYSLSIAAAYNYIGELRRAKGDMKEALHYYEQAIRVAGCQNMGAGFSIFLINAGHVAYNLAEYGKAAEYLRDALAIGEQFGEQRGYWCFRSYCTLYCILALVAVRENRLQEGRGYLEKADELLRRYQDAYQTGLALRTKLELCIWMQYDRKIQAVFGDYLLLSTQEYYRQGKELFVRLADEFEQKMLDDVFAARSSIF